MSKWFNAYKAPYSNDVMISVGYATRKKALENRRKSMAGRYIGKPIKISFESKTLIKVFR
jgi:hypothetical protein